MEQLIKKICKKNKGMIGKGKVADYIPALKKADPKDLGICIFDVHGNAYMEGDYNKKFTVQSISKVVTLMLALLDNGEEVVFNKVGVESTDDYFDSLYKLDMLDITKPTNPMVNSGAIVVTSLIKGKNFEEKNDRLMDFFKKVTLNQKLTINEEVYLSEMETGNKNKSIAYLMKSKGIIEGDVEEVLDLYFKQCSIEVDCIDIANMGLLLALGGKQPNTGKEIITKRIAEITRAIMATCGMYNASGQFALDVGFPGKSGVGGGILGVVPDTMGIGVYSPELDENGNSIAGYGILKDLSKELNLNIY